MIYYFISPNDSFSMSIDDFDLQKTRYNKVKPNEFETWPYRPRFWDEYFLNCDKARMRVFIVRQSLVDHYGTGTIISKKWYSLKYILSINDLEKLKWEISFKN